MALPWTLFRFWLHLHLPLLGWYSRQQELKYPLLLTVTTIRSVRKMVLFLFLTLTWQTLVDISKALVDLWIVLLRVHLSILFPVSLAIVKMMEHPTTQGNRVHMPTMPLVEAVNNHRSSMSRAGQDLVTGKEDGRRDLVAKRSRTSGVGYVEQLERFCVRPRRHLCRPAAACPCRQVARRWRCSNASQVLLVLKRCGSYLVCSVLLRAGARGAETLRVTVPVLVFGWMLMVGRAALARGRTDTRTTSCSSERLLASMPGRLMVCLMSWLWSWGLQQAFYVTTCARAAGQSPRMQLVKTLLSERLSMLREPCTSPFVRQCAAHSQCRCT